MKRHQYRVPFWLKAVVVGQTALIVFLLGNLAPLHLRVIPLGMSYQDWISILLTGLAALISVLGLFLAILAFIGWQTFDRNVAKRVKENLDVGFKRDGFLRRDLQDAVEAVSYDIGVSNNDGVDEFGDED